MDISIITLHLLVHEHMHMRTTIPNRASIIKDEIVRLVRKEVRNQVEGLRRSSAQYRVVSLIITR